MLKEGVGGLNVGLGMADRGGIIMFARFSIALLVPCKYSLRAHPRNGDGAAEH